MSIFSNLLPLNKKTSSANKNSSSEICLAVYNSRAARFE
jgi:hypothetical protein